MFQWDGALKDIYVQDVTLSDWVRLIDFIKNNYSLTFDSNENDKIDKEYIVKYLQDKSDNMENKQLTIDNNGISICCHFFKLMK